MTPYSSGNAYSIVCTISTKVVLRIVLSVSEFKWFMFIDKINQYQMYACIEFNYVCTMC